MLFDQRVPMRDGATLSADVTLPATALERGERVPVILMRTPYVKSDMRSITAARYYAERGYAFVAMDVRGRGDSDGVFVPYVNDGIDGYDAIEWLAQQPWSDGAVGTVGGSYPGCIQWLTALHQPPHLRAMIVLVTPADPFVETPTGLPSRRAMMSLPTGCAWRAIRSSSRREMTLRWNDKIPSCHDVYPSLRRELKLAHSCPPRQRGTV
jgi:putative CocE/NonD family hydrolase